MRKSYGLEPLHKEKMPRIMRSPFTKDVPWHSLMGSAATCLRPHRAYVKSLKLKHFWKSDVTF